MSGSLNRVMLIGRLTRDPELRFTPSGTAVCNLALATNRYGQDASGERREFTDYHDIVVWNQGNRKLAELCGQYLQKGRMVYIEGRLQTRSWDDKDTGAKRYKTEVNANDVQFLDSRQDGGEGGGARGDQGQPAGAAAGAGAAVPALGANAGGDVDPDDIPF
jgi:single-strand DNA-binding protein